jgi:hypothetical protein
MKKVMILSTSQNFIKIFFKIRFFLRPPAKFWLPMFQDGAGNSKMVYSLIRFFADLFVSLPFTKPAQFKCLTLRVPNVLETDDQAVFFGL